MVVGLGRTEFDKIHRLFEFLEARKIFHTYQDGDRLAMAGDLHALTSIVCPVDNIGQMFAQSAYSDRARVDFHTHSLRHF